MKKSITLLLVFCCLLSLPCTVTASGADSRQGEMRDLKGVVVDQQGTPLIGVSVVIKGKSGGGVATGVNGQFSIRIPREGATLLFSFIGMEPKTVAVTTQTTLRVQMKESSESIEEITIVGAYGTIQKRSEMVGSAYQVNADKLKNLPAARIDKMLEGLVPGFNIEAQNDYGGARSRYNLRIRGNTSLSAGNEPLWIVDGVPIYTGDDNNAVTGVQTSVSPLSYIDPADIESITVLKDATETSIYGANGSSGIILVTTKQGKAGAPTLNVSLKYGVSLVDKSTRYKILNGPEYMMLAREAWANAGYDSREFPFQDNDFNTYSATNTDWYDLFFDVGQTVQANVSMTGGNDRMRNYLGVNYFRETTALEGNSADRISARFGTSYKLSKRFTFDLKSNMSYNINNIFSLDRDYYTFKPIVSPYNEDGTYRLKNKEYTAITLAPGDIDPWTNQPVTSRTTVYWPQEYNFFNSLAERDENTNRQRTFNTISSAALKYEFIPGLTLSASFGVHYIGTYEDIYQARTNLSGISYKRADKEEDPERKMVHTPVGYSRRSQANFLNWINNEQLNYQKRFGKHLLSGLAGFEMTSTQRQSLEATGNGYPNDEIQEVNYASTRNGGSNSSVSRKMSYMFQVKYAYDNRYFLTANFRSDGTSDFDEFSQWTNFASAGVSWNVHREKFFNVDFINQLKLRISYGSAGNSKISSAISRGVYTTSLTSGYNGELGSRISEIANPGIGWEITDKFNLGLDIGLFDRLNISLDYYNNITRDLISQLYVSRIIGQSRVYRNAGKMRNMGVELTLDYHVIRQKDWDWTLSANLSHNRNKILKLNDDGRMVSFGNTAWVEGEDMDAHMLIRWAGVDPRDGAPLWYDKNGNVTRVYSYDNRVPYKTKRPTIYGGFSTMLRWKDLSLSAFFNYSVGGYANSSLASSGMTDGRDIVSQNQAVEMLDRWQYPGQLAANPVNIANLSRYTASYNTRFLYSKTYLRLSNLALSYNLPDRFCSRVGIKGAAVSFIGNNLFLWTPRDYANRNSYKTLMQSYPQERSFMLGIDLSF